MEANYETKLLQNGIYWPEEQALPTFAEPDSIIYVINVIDQPADIKLAMVTLQGLINRNRPKILVANDGGEGNFFWAEELGLSYRTVDNYVKMFDRYYNEIEGLVIYDTTTDNDYGVHTINIATTIAGIKNGIAVSDSIADMLNAEPYNIPVVEDLRDKGFSSKYDVYNYLYDNYWDQCTKRLIVSIYTGIHAHIRDIAVAVNAPVLWLNPTENGGSADDEILDKFFNTGTKTYVTGFWPDEILGIRYATGKNVSTVPSDYFENYTVFSGQAREISNPEVPRKPDLENKIYVSLNISDGDNIQYVQHAMQMGHLWRNPFRGQVPIGWTCTPALIDSSPQILNYLYRTATDNDVLVCGPSGMGYTLSEYWPDTFIAGYAETTNDYFERTGFNIITIWHLLENNKAVQFVNNLPSLIGMNTMSWVDSIIQFAGNVPYVFFGTAQYGAMSYDGFDYNTDYSGQNISLRMQEVYNNDFDGTTPMFYAAQVSAWGYNVEQLTGVANFLKDTLGDAIEFVRPDHFMMLLKEHNNKEFNIALRASTTSSTSIAGFGSANAVDGSFALNNGWRGFPMVNAWLQITFDNEYLISRYVVKNFGLVFDDSTLNTRDFNLQYSTDGVNWTDAPGGEVSGNTDNIAYVSLSAPVNARSVRLVITNPGSDGFPRIQEIEVYGRRNINE